MNPSQRSSRYCDETDTPYIIHPLLTQYLNRKSDHELGQLLEMSEHQDKTLYLAIVTKVQNMLMADGVDKLTARKQARAAGRYYLGNGLQTALVFTASVAHWKHIFKLRVSRHADAEIRTIMAQALGLAKTSIWGDAFQGMEVVETATGPVLKE